MTITRDDWGIAHVHGKSDADAVFGMIYAQAEDDFPRIEANYLTALGRTAEAEGEKAIWQDLRARLYVSEPELKADYAASPAWLKRLMDSLGRRAELLSRDPSEREAARAHAVRAVDGAVVHRRQHRRRHRADRPGRARALLLRASKRGALDARRPSRAGSNGIAIAPAADRRRQGAAADQPAHQLLLPLRAAGDERRGPQRLWRRDLGPVLHLPGVQRPCRLDAHVERRR